MTYDVYGLGNALVDLEYRIDDGFLGLRSVQCHEITFDGAQPVDQVDKRACLVLIHFPSLELRSES